MSKNEKKRNQFFYCLTPPLSIILTSEMDDRPSRAEACIYFISASITASVSRLDSARVLAQQSMAATEQVDDV